MALKSLEPSDIEWQTVDLHQPDTWDNWMSELKDNSVQLIFTSPPYYNLKEYSTKPKIQKGQLPHSPKQFKTTYEEYLDDMNNVLKECYRVIKEDGVLIINLDVIKFKTKA